MFHLPLRVGRRVVFVFAFLCFFWGGGGEGVPPLNDLGKPLVIIVFRVILLHEASCG